ncbi:hypothetical protein D3C80_1324690 [compost metagenome]
MQVFLPQALAVHLANGGQCFGQDRCLLVHQNGLCFNLLPGITEAFGAFKKLEQQPTALTVFQAISQQQWRRQTLSSEQTHALELTLKMSRGLAAHQQLGQHRTTAPYSGAHITLPWQYPQQTEQL